MSLSRRQVLAQIAAAGAVGAAAVVSGKTAASVPKLKPEDVAYQTTPMGDQRCSNCQQFTPPNICNILTTRVVPSGWCSAWMMKKV